MHERGDGDDDYEDAVDSDDGGDSNNGNADADEGEEEKSEQLRSEEGKSGVVEQRVTRSQAQTIDDNNATDIRQFDV